MGGAGGKWGKWGQNGGNVGEMAYMGKLKEGGVEWKMGWKLGKILREDLCNRSLASKHGVAQ